MIDDFYGLSGKPFQLTPDPAFYFQSLTHRKALSYLSYGLAQGEGFIVITGEVGAGKSTLVGHLMAAIDRARLTAAQVVTSRLGGEELIHVVARSFGFALDGHDKASALGAIESYLHEEARAGRRCLLIVDESQNLTIEALEELRMLSNFQLGSQPLLQTLLLGQPEFRVTLLESPCLEQLRQRVIAIHHLDAMEPAEVQPYIEHRMKCVGWTGHPAFDPHVFANIYAATDGVPRRINQIANRLLLLGAVDQRDCLDGDMLAQVLAEMAYDNSMEPARTARTDCSPRSDGIDPAALEMVLAQRDVRIGELEQAVIELANAAETAPKSTADNEVAALRQHIAKLEDRIAEQDHMIRHTLTMLIEWIEADDAQRSEPNRASSKAMDRNAQVR
jgi:putative secretion ATPase (PEP-CTERM system associated)